MIEPGATLLGLSMHFEPALKARLNHVTGDNQARCRPEIDSRFQRLS
jgi:hypothetical protein